MVVAEALLIDRAVMQEVRGEEEQVALFTTNRMLLVLVIIV